MTDVIDRRSALISESGLHRYKLEREWLDNEGAAVMFVMLNPSTADGTQDDPTIRRCINFAKREDGGQLLVGNLFAYRATDPTDLVDSSEAGIDIIGTENDAHLAAMARRADLIIAAWGAHPIATERAAEVMSWLTPSRAIFSLGTTKAGAPRHPLYLPATAPLTEWRTPA